MILAAFTLAQPPDAGQKQTVSGSVINAAGAPLRRVSLQLTSLGRGQASTFQAALSGATDTDSQGNFTFDDVAPGRYLLTAQRTGYLNAQYHTARGWVLTVAPDQKTTGLVIKMTSQGIVAGTVVDEEDEPLPGATVYVSPYFPSGDPAAGFANPLGQGKTDADGVFAIGSLPPGRYGVSAVAPPEAGSPTTRPQSRQEIYVTTYYPDAIDSGAGTPVELGAGAQVRGLEIRLQKVPVFKVSGKVVNGVTNEAASGVVLALFRQGAVPGVSARSTGVSAGDFSFDGVPPGSYVLEIKSAGEGENNAALVGRQNISVGGRDLSDVVMELRPGIELNGSVIVEGAPPPAWPQITLTPMEGVNYPTEFAMIDENGRFLVTGLEPAPYRVNIGSMSPPTFIKSIRFNGRDIGNEPIDLASAPKGSLEIAISDKGSSLTGVVNDSGMPVGPGVVVMAHRKGLSQPRIAQTDDSGRFLFRSLPPGEYLLSAMDSGTGFVRITPELSGKFEKAVTVGESVEATAELQLITLDNLQVDSR